MKIYKVPNGLETKKLCEIKKGDVFRHDFSDERWGYEPHLIASINGARYRAKEDYRTETYWLSVTVLDGYLTLHSGEGCCFPESHYREARVIYLGNTEI